MRAVAAQKKAILPSSVSIDSSVGIGKIPGGFGIEVALRVSIPGMTKADAEALVQAAHQVCPYSNATRNNVEVSLSVV
jgi:osmotically inducible protein OsmC